MAYIYDLTDTWNAGGTTFNGIKLNVTDSASAVSSKLVTLQTNGTEHFSVTKAGQGYFSGNLGVGTSSPAAKLEVAGATTITNGVLDMSTGYSIRWGGAASGIQSGSGTADMVFTAGSSERMRVNGSTGNVGIGTSAPAEKLTVQVNTGTSGFEGGITLTNGVDANLFSYVTGTAATDKRALITVGATAQSLAFGTLYNERMRILADGNVLVGRTTAYGQPYRMVVNGDSGASAIPMAINDDRSGTADSRILAFLRGGTETGYITSTNNTLAIAGSTTLTFQTVSSEQMRITNTGNVGIGTSSPSAKLDVKSQINVTNSSNVSINAVRGSGFGYSSAYSALVLGATSGNVTPCINVDPIANTDGSFSGNGAEVMFRNGVNFITPNAANNSYNTNIFTMLDGKVGIGTALPRGKMEIVGPASETSTLANAVTNAGLLIKPYSPSDWGLAFGSLTGQVQSIQGVDLSGSGSRNIAINALGGNVGIGTASPAYRLQVSSGGGGDAEIVASNTASPERIHMFSRYSSGNSYLHSQNSNLLFGTFDNYQLLIHTNNIERARFDASGNFLVGTSTSVGLVNAVKNGGDIYYASQTASGGYCYTSSAANNGGTYYHMLFSEGGTARGTITSNGSTVSYNTSSDYRLKDIDGPIANSGAYIDALKPVQGSWKADGSRFIGLLAHEAQEVSETPIATGEKDGEKMQAMDYSAPEIIANLIAELQSLRARVAQLEGN